MNYSCLEVKCNTKVKYDTQFFCKSCNNKKRYVKVLSKLYPRRRGINLGDYDNSFDNAIKLIEECRV